MPNTSVAETPAETAGPMLLDSPAAETSLQILARLNDGFQSNVQVKLWDGRAWQSGRGPASFTIVLKHPGALRAMFWPVNPAVAFGEAYIFDDFDVEGD